MPRTVPPPAVPDAELVRRFVAGRDEAAFELLVWRYRGLVADVCRRALGHAHDAEVPLFNPRTDRWDEHFAFEVDTGNIRGLTPCGRATVGQLCMNDPLPLAARLLWVDLGIYP